MASFDKYAPKLKRWEGGFANHPNDPGHETMCGVTLATFRSWYGADKTVEDLRRMTDAQWRHIMKTGFWDKCWGDQISSQAVAELIVDWCVNSGTGMIRKVQEIVGTKVDGIVGPKTVAQINAARAQVLHYKIKAARAAWYAQLVVNRPSNISFYDGWMNRLASFTYR